MSKRVVSTVLLLLCACGDSGKQEPPQVAASSGAEAGQPPGAAASREPPPLPEPFEATFSLPVRVPFDAIERRVDEALPRHQSENYQQLTRPGQSPEIEARYEVWREPVSVSFSDSALHVEVPLRYVAAFNARLRNPLGGGWLTVARQEPWGTRAEPLRVTLRLHTEVTVARDWRLSLRTTVDAPEHGPPPSGKLCTPGSFKLCVPKASIAPEVQKQLDKELLSRMRKEIAAFDREVVELIALRSRAQEVFLQLAQPRRFDEHGRFMAIDPKGLALDLRGEGEALLVEPAIWARVTYHEQKPETAPPALPAKSPMSALPGPRVALPEGFAPEQLQRLLEAL